MKWTVTILIVLSICFAKAYSPGSYWKDRMRNYGGKPILQLKSTISKLNSF